MTLPVISYQFAGPPTPNASLSNSLTSPLAATAPGPVAKPILSEEDYEAVRDAMPTWRDRLITMTLRITGLRISEVLGMQVHACQVEGPRYFIWAQRGKTRKSKVPYEEFYLGPNLGIQLRDWIKGQRLGPQDQIFNIQPRQYRNVCYAAGEKALGRRMNPHELRWFYIKDLLDKGAPVPVVSKLVGHTDSRTTMEYYYRLSSRQREQIANSLRP